MVGYVYGVCLVCNKRLSESENVLMCYGTCRKWYHIGCVNVSLENYKKIRELGNLVCWFCERCTSQTNLTSNDANSPVSKGNCVNMCCDCFESVKVLTTQISEVTRNQIDLVNRVDKLHEENIELRNILNNRGMYVDILECDQESVKTLGDKALTDVIESENEFHSVDIKVENFEEEFKNEAGEPTELILCDPDFIDHDVFSKDLTELNFRRDETDMNLMNKSNSVASRIKRKRLMSSKHRTCCGIDGDETETLKEAALQNTSSLDVDPLYFNSEQCLENIEQLGKREEVCSNLNQKSKKHKFLMQQHNNSSGVKSAVHRKQCSSKHRLALKPSEALPGSRPNSVIYHDNCGYYYHGDNRSLKTKRLLRCIERHRGCKARATMDFYENAPIIPTPYSHDHDHPPDLKRMKKKVLLLPLKDHSRKNAGVSSTHKLDVESSRKKLTNPIWKGVTATAIKIHNNKRVGHTFIRPIGSGRKKRKSCTGCYKMLRKTMTSKEAAKKVPRLISYCQDCDGQPGFCLPCFEVYHTMK
ncbi:uncharacterized protein LOC142323284 [Lycorma delicatula]|uniref:uncharacterized protein LOC142323284 n=1 Tax=Lycorma delicatula TaxID=130591 RepID=UPI003F510680